MFIFQINESDKDNEYLNFFKTKTILASNSVIVM